MFLQSPDQEAPESRLADWLELLAACSPDRAVGRGDVQKIVRMEDDERQKRRTFDADSGDTLETEILAEDDEDLARKTFTEIERRQALLGEDYPFLIERVGAGLPQSLKIQWRGELESYPDVQPTCFA